jgi:very-short-patch-repair endonuclease
MPPRKTQEEFEQHAIKKHNGIYDYSEFIYVNDYTKGIIICKICNKKFQQTPSNHFQGHGCRQCAIKQRSKLQTKTKENFEKEANKKHNGKYDYSEFIYINNRQKSTIICPVHGKFQQTASDHLQGNGCRDCGYIESKKKQTKTQKQFEIEANKKHDDKYDYSKFIYVNDCTKSIIICPEHDEFHQTPNGHLHGFGCPTCKSSYGEKNIKHLLDKQNIEYIQQFKFHKCKYINALPFDFYLPKYNLLIEFDGVQHYKPIEYFGGNDAFNSQIIKDSIKNNHCQDNNLILLRIPYFINFHKHENIILTVLDYIENNKNLYWLSVELYDEGVILILPNN